MRPDLKKIDELNLFDILTADTHGEVIRVEDKNNNVFELIKDRKMFFENIFAKSNGNVLELTKNGEKYHIMVDDFLKSLDTETNSILILLEGYAGCGKSTLVQYILWKQIPNPMYDYSFYNYNLEINYVYDEEDKSETKSSIFRTIRRNFIQKFVEISKNNNNVYREFLKLLEHCKKFSQFRNLYYDFYITSTFKDINKRIQKGITDNSQEDTIIFLLDGLIKELNDSSRWLALDYILRLAMYKCRKTDKLYICYDNLDAIEDANDLNNFDDKLIKFRSYINEFILFLRGKNYFDKNMKTPHFVIFATYRKITARMAIDTLNNYSEVDDDQIQSQYVYHIDATSTFSYKDIVKKRTSFFRKYIEKSNDIDEDPKKTLLQSINNWECLNDKLEIMKDKYACLWNKNYRTCSLIAEELCSKSGYKITELIEFINNNENMDSFSDLDGYDITSYYGSSAILLNLICKVFNGYGIWTKLLKLVELNHEKKAKNEKNISFSRMILTYIYNKNRPVSLKELYDEFCLTELFEYDDMCKILANMLARNDKGVWRRPIYYAKGVILSTKAKDICNKLQKECMKICEDKSSNFSFMLCDSGIAYVERLMQEFEFYSNRIKQNNFSLYLYDDIAEIENIIDSVYNSVAHCVENMQEFMNRYIEAKKISLDEYIKLPIHPITKRGGSQFHTERVIFSHIAYLNNVREYFIYKAKKINEKRQYNNLFVKMIKKYLDLYDNSIRTICDVRADVADGLREIVNKIEEENKNTNADEKILFKSISLNHLVTKV